MGYNKIDGIATQIGFDKPLVVTLGDEHSDGYAGIRLYEVQDDTVYPDLVDAATYPENYDVSLLVGDSGYVYPDWISYDLTWTEEHPLYVEKVITELYLENAASGRVKYEGFSAVDHKWYPLDNGDLDLTDGNRGFASWQGPIGRIRATCTDVTGFAEGFRLTAMAYRH